MRRPVLLLLLALSVLPLVLGACAGSAAVVATFQREWEDGRIETLELREDGRVQMDHFGTIDRTTLSASDVATLRDALSRIEPAADPDALPRLTLTPAGREPVVVDAAPGTAGELFLALLERHEHPSQ
jgi:hypothetical protein